MSTESSQVHDSGNRIFVQHLQSILERVGSAIKALRTEQPANDEQAFNPLGSDLSATVDIDKISLQLAIESRARADGGNEQPPSKEEIVAGTQREIIVYFKRLQRSAQHQVTVLANRLRGLREIIDLPEAMGRLQDIPSRCENEILRLTAEFQSQLGFLTEKEQQQRLYETLREEEPLRHGGKYAENPALPYALVVVLLGAAAVAIVNAARPGLASTLLVSIAWAVAMSLAFVLVPFVLGIVVSRAGTLTRHLRVLGTWLGGGIAITFIAAAALYTAHYVAALSNNSTVTALSVMQAVRGAPAAIGADVAAWTSFALVALAGLLACLVGYQSGDTYPSQRTIQKILHRTRNEREYRTKQMRKRINTIIDKAEDEASALLQHVKSQVRQYSQLVEDANHVPENLSEYDIALEDACNILLHRYRSVNGNARRTEWPMSFSEHVCFRTEHDQALSLFSDEESRLERLNRGVIKLESEIATIRQQLRDLNWNAISDLQERPWRREKSAASGDEKKPSRRILPPSETVVPAAEVRPLAIRQGANY